MAEIQIPKQHKAYVCVDPPEMAIKVEIVDMLELGIEEVLISL